MSLQFQPKNAISQTGDEVECVKGLDPVKAVLVSRLLFFFCGGIAVGLEVKEDVLGSLQQLLNPLVYLPASCSSSTGVVRLHSVLLCCAPASKRFSEEH